MLHLFRTLMARPSLLAVGLVVVVICGCATRNDQPFKAYDGPARPRHEIAIVKTVLPGLHGLRNHPTPELPMHGYLKMVSVDGVATTSLPLQQDPPQLDLAPGKHTIGVRFVTSTASAQWSASGAVTHEFETGRVYVLDVRVLFGEKKAIFYLRPLRNGEE